MEEMAFINRVEELMTLKKLLSGRGPELIILYGRRRIGKSRLLSELNKSLKADITVMFEEGDYSHNLRKFSEIIAKKYSYPNFRPSDFKEAFSAIPSQAIIIIDEFSYLSNIGEFQAVWEEISKKKQHKIILCGSLIKVMEDLNYSLKSPLYGRATAVLKLTPLKIKHMLQWYKGHKLEEVLNMNFLVGGVPRYLELFPLPQEKYVMDNFFNKNGLLLREGKLLLKESFPSSEIYPKILFSIAAGQTEATKIANSTGINPNQVSKYLSILADYGFVERRMPLLKAGKKDVRFFIADNFFAFWTLFVRPYYGEIESGLTDNAVHNYKQNFNSFSGRRFEKAVQEIIPDIFPAVKDMKLAPMWWREDKQSMEIDLLGINEANKELLAVECKWQDSVDAEAWLSSLKEKVNCLNWHLGKRKEGYMVIAKSFKRRTNKAVCIDLKDMERILKKKNI